MPVRASNGMKKSILIWVGVFAGTFLALFLLIKYQGGTVADSGKVYPEVSIISSTDQTKGKVDSKVVLVEYGDFQCPACAAFQPLVDEIMNTYGDRIQLVFRDFPLPQHQFAVPAARYAEAAGKQGKYWEMYDKIYAGQTKWASLKDADPIFQSYAQDLKLDMVMLKKDMDSDSIKTGIEDDRLSGVKFYVNSTPTFFLNGKKLVFKSLNYEEFKSYIDTALGG